MLTKNDLKAIDGLFTKRMDEAITNRIEPMITKQLRREIHQEIKPLKEDIAKIRKDINLLVSFFDREYVNLRTRIERIEDHLHLPAISS